MSSTGTKAPGTATTTAEAPWSDDAWVNPANIYGAGEASVTTTAFDAGDQTEVLKAYNFDFTALSTTATIQGVECTINARYANAPASIDLVQILDTTRAKTGTNLAATPTALGTAAANYTFGAGTNTWGNALTPAWLKDADFGVAIGCLAGGAGNNNVDVYIDTVTINVYYTELVTADAGSFTLGGQDAGLLHKKILTADAGSYVLGGQDATLVHGYTLAADAGSYALNGQDAGLLKTNILTADAGSYALSGQDASLLHHYVLTADIGAYTYSGGDATLTKTASNALVLSASDYITASGENTTAQLAPPTGKTVTDFEAGRMADDENPLDSIDLGSGKYTELEWCIKATTAAGTNTYEFRVTAKGTALNTYSVTPTLSIVELNNYSMAADAGAYDLTGQAASLFAGKNITADTGSYSLSGQDASLQWHHLLTADSGAYTYTGEAATLTYAGLTHYSMTADIGGYTYTGETASLLAGRLVTGDAGAYTYTGNAATFPLTRYIGAGAGTYTYTGNDADLTRRVQYSPTSKIITVKRGVIYADQRQEVDAESDVIYADQRNSIAVKRTVIKAE